MAIQSRPKRTNKKPERRRPKASAPRTYETPLNLDLVARELLGMAEKLTEAQDNFLSFRADGGSSEEGLELLGTLWSVRECLKLEAVRLSGGVS